MSKICPLFSGSEGNSIYVGDSGGALLIDAGRSSKQIECALHSNGLNAKNINAIFLTHEHNDHVSGLRVFAKKYKIKVYGSYGTVEELKKKKILDDQIEYKTLSSHITDLDNFSIRSFDISHDCAQGYGYTIKFKRSGLKVSVCSDLGFVSELVIKSISGSDVVFLESNHDVKMLQNGTYPYFLKKRILSDKGHISNLDCSYVLPKLVYKNTTRFVLCHLSSENNTPKLAYDAAIDSLSKHGMKEGNHFEIFIAPKFNNGELNIFL